MEERVSYRQTRRAVPAAVVVGLAGAVLMAATGGVPGRAEGERAGLPPVDAPAATPAGNPTADAVGGAPGVPGARTPALPTGVERPEATRTRTAGAEVPPPRPRPGPNADVLLATALAELDPPDPVRLSVRALDPATGTVVSAGDGFFDTASIVKVNIVAALLFLCQEEGRGPDPGELAGAAAAIRYSDNAATDRLWRRIGGEEGLDALNSRWGLTGTTGGEDGHWGLTRTTGDDQLRLLEIVFGPSGPLSPDSRALLRELMGEVAEEQRWGISAAAVSGAPDFPTGAGTGTMAGLVVESGGPDATTPAPLRESLDTPAAAPGGARLKNGWLPRSHTRLWDINSIGRVTVDGRPLLMVVLSDGHTGRESGIEVVEAAARAAAAVLRTAGAPRA
ncbi:serine hydrolase [Streptomyces sp. ST2-7A]|uniref:serine hydrolase n=1 Tax=Streptomyces sp. ST2-7A TaxID=2907214 RepID=UPI001F338181|nr:serine hydrolase [Streptomyces sp. ST2-7A]MCE7082593.1 class A beta-lactamase-related serine hydrolase [Streptomyces sp. ST2-7A]